MNWKDFANLHDDGYFTLATEETGDVPVRLFLTPQLLEEVEDDIYKQIVNATKFPGVKLVCITPDVHVGYGVPIGCVLVTDGTLCLGPVGYDIGCFTGDTLIPLADGKSYPIKELAEKNEEFWCFALNPKHKVEVAKATAKKTRVSASLVKVALDNEQKIICTPDHQFMLRDGTYCEAQNLSTASSLMPFYYWQDKDGYSTVNHKVVSVELLDYSEDVYCLTVPEYGNFALDAGVFVHNCGMMSARSTVPWDMATPKKRLEFNRAVMAHVEMGVGSKSKRLPRLTSSEFENLIRGGAEYYCEHYGSNEDRSHAERNRLPVDDSWQPLYGGKGKPERGMNQLGSLGAGNHFLELQRCIETDTLFLQVHTGSRGFGHGLATNFFELAKKEHPEQRHIDMGYFTPDSPNWKNYLNAVNAGGNFAILNRLIIFEQVAEAFKKVFGSELTMIYEISHNLAQYEWTGEEFGYAWVHRKGATRALPAGHPGLVGSQWEHTGHPVLIPGSNQDYSFILTPAPGAEKCAFSVNHGAGRRMSRTKARQQLSQEVINVEYAKAGILVNDHADVPLDEAGPCYKSSEEVIEAVVKAGLATVQYRLWPLASLKGLD
jgi:tRNA-splicing ligase RtcB